MMWGQMRPRTCARKTVRTGALEKTCLDAVGAEEDFDVVLPLVGEELVQLVGVEELEVDVAPPRLRYVALEGSPSGTPVSAAAP